MSSETTYKIILQGSDGKQYHIDLSDSSNVEWFRQKIGICKLKAEIQAEIEGLDKRIDYMQKRQEEIVKVVTEMLLPFFTKGAILDFLKENKDVNTRHFHDFLNRKNGVLDRAFWYAKQKLEEEGKIESIKQGRGKLRLWRVKP